MFKRIKESSRVLVLAAGLCLVVGCSIKPTYVPTPGLDAQAFQQVVDDLSAPEMEGRDAGTAGIERARDYLVDRFKHAGLKPAFVIDGQPSYTQPFTLSIGKDAEGKAKEARIDNIGALLPGVGALADEIVVVGAHYDHVGYGHIGSRAKDQKGEIHPGADDNASGTAVVILLAEHFAKRAAKDQAMPRRTIFFTGFAGEERGLRGSRYMTQHPEQWAFAKEDIQGMINMDMVGRVTDNKLYVFTDATGKQWRRWVKYANQWAGLDLQWDVRAPGGSDHTPFIAVDVPAIFLNNWLHADYHTPRDTPDKINARGGAQVMTLVGELVERSATTTDRLVFVEPAKPGPLPSLGVRMEDREGPGAVLNSVAEGGPMHQAGAQPGDVLLSLGGTPIKARGEVRLVLLKSKVGQKLPVLLERAGRTLELTVKLGTR